MSGSKFIELQSGIYDLSKVFRAHTGCNKGVIYNKGEITSHFIKLYLYDYDDQYIMLHYDSDCIDKRDKDYKRIKEILLG